MSFRMYYVDDSGDNKAGIAVYSWIEVDPEQAMTALAVWLRFRGRLFELHQIPEEVEIHAVKFLSGRGRPSAEEKVNKSKELRHEIFLDALKTISELPGVNVGAVYRRSPHRPSRFADVMRDTFCKLVLGIDRRLFLTGLQGVMIIDGEGDSSCREYFRLFRGLDLSGRQLIGGPLFQPSDESQWVQIADIVAYTAFQSVIRRPGREFCWTWYEDYIDPDGPREV
ncbi:DUF3800 domain-containing protein [Catenulispora sp. GAS73]|uniref:DUF3800 domain-containing protein n=1 Tax=Catenulispora sp. GAS73 TaxID=3156269 RepID=UPI003516CC14